MTVGGSLELAVADGHGRMFVNVEDRNEVVVLNTRSQKSNGASRCLAAKGRRESSTIRRRTTSFRPAPMVWRSSLRRNGKIVAHLTIGRGADGAAFDPGRHVALVPAGRDGNLTVIRLSPAPAVVTRITTAIGARTIAVDPSTGRAFLPSATMAAPVGNERPKPLPGTFRVLVVEP